jgi:hypothetical protein
LRSSPIIIFAFGAFTIIPLEELGILLGGASPQFFFLKQEIRDFILISADR